MGAFEQHIAPGALWQSACHTTHYLGIITHIMNDHVFLTIFPQGRAVRNICVIQCDNLMMYWKPVK